jgi:hypothetical protein
MTELLPFVAGLPPVDHHCHGVVTRDVTRAGFEAMLTVRTHDGGSRAAEIAAAAVSEVDAGRLCASVGHENAQRIYRLEHV